MAGHNQELLVCENFAAMRTSLVTDDLAARRTGADMAIPVIRHWGIGAARIARDGEPGGGAGCSAIGRGGVCDGSGGAFREVGVSGGADGAGRQ